MSKSDSDFPAAVGFSLDIAEDADDTVLSEKEKQQKLRFQQAMLAQKVKGQISSSQKRPLTTDPVSRPKKKGEYFSLPSEKADGSAESA